MNHFIRKSLPLALGISLALQSVTFAASADLNAVRYHSGSEHDRVVWPFVQDNTGAVLLAGDEFEVDGPVADWTSGPWSNPVAGVTFDLNRVEG